MSMPTVFIVDDAESVRDSLSLMLCTAGFATECHESAESFLAVAGPDRPGCLILDLRMPGMSGIELQEELTRRGICLPTVFVSAYGDVRTTVQALQGGAQDFLTKPVDGEALLAWVRVAVEQDRQWRLQQQARTRLVERMARLSAREREILALALAGETSGEIAKRLGISPRTVETHRAHILLKLDARSLLEFARAAAVAGITIPEMGCGGPD